MLEQKMASLDVSEKEQVELLEDLQRKETEYTRLMRNRLCVEDFDLLSIIGRGAFGEVSLFEVYVSTILPTLSICSCSNINCL